MGKRNMSSLQKFLIRWLATSVSVAAAVLLVDGIRVEAESVWFPLLMVGLIVGLVSSTIGTFVKIGAFGCIVMTLGLMNLVINAGLLMISANIAGYFDVPFFVDDFWSAFWGGIVISLTSTVLSAFLSFED